MFLPCPHCQFPVAASAADGTFPALCPRCGEALDDFEGAVADPPAVPLGIARLLRDPVPLPGLLPDPAPEPVPEPDLPRALPGADLDGPASRDPLIDDFLCAPAPDGTGSHAVPGAATGARVAGAPATDAPARAAGSAATGGDAMDADPRHADPVDDDPMAESVTDDTSAGQASDLAYVDRPYPVLDQRESYVVRVAGAASPRFARDAAASPRRPARAGPWQWAAVVALAVVLLLQVLVADRAALAMSARWRPLLASTCGVLGCALPPWREPAAFSMLDRNVRPVPGQPGALRVDAAFRNDARWDQAWPVLVLTLSDADGRTVGRRAVQPVDYLAATAAPATVGTGQSAQVSFLVREPAANIVAFTFDFE